MEATAWFAMYAPAGLPPETLKRLEAVVAKAIHQPAMQQKLEQLGYEPVGSNSAELAAAQRADLARWEKPIKATGITLD
jgi:tripartite-type tricarboxylate transporter receptor subunit TctC